MARGGARVGAGRKAGKSANTSTVSRGRAPAREAAGIRNAKFSKDEEIYAKTMRQPWPADKVERWAIDRLIPYARNARTHSDEQIAQIAASIREFGFTNPVLVDEEGTLIAGLSGAAYLISPENRTQLCGKFGLSVRLDRRPLPVRPDRIHDPCWGSDHRGAQTPASP